MNGLSEALENIVKEAISETIGEHDFSDAISEAVGNHDFDDDVEKVVGNYDFSDAISEAVTEFDFNKDIERALEDFDFSDAINASLVGSVDEKVEKAVEDFDFTDAINDALDHFDFGDEIDNRVDCLRAEMKEQLKSPEFRSYVKGIVMELVSEKVAAYKLAIKNVMLAPFRKVRSLLLKAKGKIRKWFKK